MAGFRIRPAANEDLPLLSNLLGAACREFGLSEEDWGMATAETDLHTAWRTGGGELWVLDADGSLGGVAGVRPDGRGGAEVRPFLLMRGWRKMGVGRMLWEAMRQHAVERSLAPLWMILPGACAESAERLFALGFSEAVAPAELEMPDDALYLTA